MKTLCTLVMIVALCSCHKQIEVIVPVKNLQFSEFASMLSKDKTYVVADYYSSDSRLSIPAINTEDTYTFDGTLNDGWVSSKEPCIEYHYNFKAFASSDSIVFEWVNFSISPQTYTVSDYKVDEWFELKQGDVYTRYKIVTSLQ